MSKILFYIVSNYFVRRFHITFFMKMRGQLKSPVFVCLRFKMYVLGTDIQLTFNPRVIFILQDNLQTSEDGDGWLFFLPSQIPPQTPWRHQSLAYCRNVWQACCSCQSSGRFKRSPEAFFVWNVHLNQNKCNDRVYTNSSISWNISLNQRQFK